MKELYTLWLILSDRSKCKKFSITCSTDHQDFWICFRKSRVSLPLSFEFSCNPFRPRCCELMLLLSIYSGTKADKCLLTLHIVKLAFPSSLLYHYCTTSFNKAWTHVLCRFKSCSQHIKDSWWWESLTMVPVENKVKHLSSVNYTTKTVHHHVELSVSTTWFCNLDIVLRY